MSEARNKIGPVLVTGSEGFLGKALIAELTAMGEQVVAFDIAAESSANERVTPCKGDIRNYNDLRAAAEANGVRSIVHLAALIIPACKANPVLGAEVDIIGHINVFEAARELGINNVLYTSTVASRPRPPLDSPVNLYGVYKRCCEDIAKVYFLDYGIPSVGLRPNVIYGPGRDVGETAAISLAMKAAALGEPFEMPFAGEMGCQHIDEVIEIFIRCLQSKPETPVISDLRTETYSMDEVIAAIKAVIPDARIKPSENLRSAPPGLDNAGLKNLLKEWNEVSLEEGARRTIAHYVH